MHRDHANKREVIVYDYIDSSVPMLARMAAKRQAGYRALGYHVQSGAVTAAEGNSPTVEATKGVGDELLPSKTFDEYWIYAERRGPRSYPEHTERGGKWMLFIKTSEVDAWWVKIRDATLSGLLGSSAKVATMKQNPNARNADTRVICVYTHDVEDEEDCSRVRQTLRDLGITWKIPYKTDADTYAGKYANRGHVRISKRYE
ncbi:MAG TPA: putative phosphothreonine lyase domain-containing protein [Candidatus Baltobacteraceae bacterium]